MTTRGTQPRVGLIGGALIFLVGSIAPAVLYFGALNKDERPTVVSVAGIVLGLTSSAILAYWAARFDKSKTGFSKRDGILTVVLACVSGAALSLALWWAAGMSLS
ncbi:hypothetical protein RCH22_003340 [Cryobacterium psychrotolerans]|nr:hypothetical protein [Cryobacterium psychrotolerans]